MRRRSAHALALVLATAGATACGGGKKPVKKPDPKPVVTKPVPKPETAADRAAKRLAAAQAIVADGATCAPATLKGSGEVVLQLGAIDSKPVLCATDVKAGRLLGPIACWTVDTKGGELAYRAPAPLPGVPFQVGIDGRCALERCLPEGAETGDGTAWMAVNVAGDSILLVGDVVHVFGADNTAKGQIKLRDTTHADKALVGEVTAAAFVGDMVYVAGGGEGGHKVFGFKLDGTAQGAVERLGGADKGPISIIAGALSPFGDKHVAIVEAGLTSMLTVEVATGKRAKLVRKPPKTACKAKELAAFAAGDKDKIGSKCLTALGKHFEPYVGAMFVQGVNNHLALLRGGRDGALVKLDGKTLVENAEFPEPWCGTEGGDAAAPAPAPTPTPAQ
jgi:hypothetical protein